MLDIDLLTTYVICGAASCAAALMTVLARTGEPGLDRALRVASGGFLLLGLALLQLVLGVPGPLSWPMLWSLFGTTVGLGAVGWGLALLAGSPVRWPQAVALIGAAVLVQQVVLHTASAYLGVAYSASIAVLCACTAWAMRGFITRPRSAVEGLLGWTMVGFVASYTLRAALGLAHEGPTPVHHAYGPPAVLRVQGILYGVMPVVVATLLLSVVNARLLAQLATRALTDELTGALNRRALMEQAPRLLADHQRDGLATALLLLDLDHFKAINDRHGHLVGDAVLRDLVRVLRATLPPDALVTRFGGEEFALLVPVRDALGAQRTAEQLRAAVAGHVFGGAGAPLQVTLSLGLAVWQVGEPLDGVLRRADSALYQAKHKGRNRVQTALHAVACV